MLAVLKLACGNLYWTQTGYVGKDCKVLFKVMAISISFSSVQKTKYSQLSRYYLANEKPVRFAAWYSSIALYMLTYKLLSMGFCYDLHQLKNVIVMTALCQYRVQVTIWYFSSNSVLKKPHNLQSFPLYQGRNSTGVDEAELCICDQNRLLFWNLKIYPLHLKYEYVIHLCIL